MSFFKKDYSAYPQPVIVTPDPRYTEDSISEAVAEAIDTEQPNTYTGKDNNKTTISIEGLGEGRRDAESNKEGDHGRRSEVSSQSYSGQHHPTDIQQEDSSQMTTAQDSQQQNDTTKLADGIMSLLGPIVQEMDFNIVSVRKSQTELEKEIERLMAELQLFLTSSSAPPDVEPAVQKLLKARRQIMTANSTLKTVQDRVDRMHHQIAKR
ncbi:hypothetical protein BGZ76_006050 [Entomortierella beljakovae]|nr:hypothetical protein BGZ76_006050 [Entomortierella beljakovae]